MIQTAISWAQRRGFYHTYKRELPTIVGWKGEAQGARPKHVILSDEYSENSMYAENKGFSVSSLYKKTYHVLFAERIHNVHRWKVPQRDEAFV